MRLSSFGCLLVVLGAGAVCHAQQSPAQPPAAPQPSTTAPSPASAPDAGVPPSEPVPPPSEPAPRGSEPAGEPVTTEPTEPASPPATDGSEPTPPPPAAPDPAPPSAADVPVGSDAIPSPGELGDRLVGDLPPAAQVKPTWTAPAPVLTLHGYLRVRGELMDTFWLGRAPLDDLFRNESPGNETLVEAGIGADPFSRFRPLERSDENLVCVDEDVVTEGSLGDLRACDVDTLQYANVRFRFSPQLNISEDVRIKATFDVLDNFVMGQGQNASSFYGSGAGSEAVFAGTNLPSGQTIVARRAWAEVRNRDLGELRFGVMPEHWGLGMLYNAGNRLDDDFSTDLGRVMGITKIAGFYLSAAYDFMSEGELRQTEEFRPGFDLSQLDDLDQFTFSVVRRVPDEDEASVLERGDLLLNGGVHFQLRNQDARLEGAGEDAMLENLSATLYTPDIWGQLRYRGIRLEIEAAGVFGTVRAQGRALDVVQFGAAFESEARLLDDKLALYFYGGFASGDSDVEGLSSFTDFVSQLNANNGVVSTFRFHPSYRVDNILWRNIMRQVTGTYYFKPGISYDFVKDDFGQLFGARLDVIWSRASSFLQTWGNDPNLGVELNAQVYWRSDDGPDVDDGYHASLQYGVLFPMAGLGYYHRSADLETAQSLRLVLGVVY